MSAKRRRPHSLDMDFELPAALTEQPKSEADFVRLARNGSLAAQRVLLIAKQLRGIRIVPTAEPRKRRGRPKNPDIDRAVMQYEFDVDHFDELRAMGWGNVPPDKRVLDVTIQRNWPKVAQDAQLHRSKRAALKDAIKQRRK